MIKYILKRVALMIPVILGISIIIFGIMEISPGDPVRMMLGEGASDEAIQEFKEEMGLSGNAVSRYLNYMYNAIQGDLGTSYRTKNEVTKDLMIRFPVTFTITTWGVLIAILFGIPLGILSAVKQYSLVDMAGQVSAMLLMAVPAFFLGLLLMLYFSLTLKWVPATGWGSWKHIILPCISIAAAVLANFMRMTRSTMLEIIRQDFVRTARAKGANQFRVIFKHALPNALLPVITSIGLLYAYLMGGAVVIENVFAINGLGTYVVNAVRNKDYPAVMGTILFLAAILCVINLIVDLTYAYIDPRIKSQYAKR